MKRWSWPGCAAFGAFGLACALLAGGSLSAPVFVPLLVAAIAVIWQFEEQDKRTASEIDGELRDCTSSV